MPALAPKRPKSSLRPPDALESDGPEFYTNYYFLTGGNYSVMGVIDAYNTNALAEAYEYDPYDEMDPGAINKAIRYTGHRFDAESGLMWVPGWGNDLMIDWMEQ